MRTLALSLVLSALAVPALAGGIVMELPNLSWPQEDQVTGSGKGCVPAPPGQVSPCK